MSSFIASSDKL